jgi:hypothetical protein
MRLITDIGQEARQLIRIETEDNIAFQFYLMYSNIRQGWFWSLAYDDFAINSCRLNLNPNILHRYRHALPFGLMCATDDSLKVNPFRIDDFVSGRIKLLSMTAQEADEIELAVYGQI